METAQRDVRLPPRGRKLLGRVRCVQAGIPSALLRRGLGQGADGGQVFQRGLGGAGLMEYAGLLQPVFVAVSHVPEAAQQRGGTQPPSGKESLCSGQGPGEGEVEEEDSEGA